mmetsp:Transcript_19653/g.33856  ORF Transcript_19653/g.33856 Transcript_19653/m.33856 type:complete len:241 (-) Transcript_19653:1490-2212(-)
MNGVLSVKNAASTAAGLSTLKAAPQNSSLAATGGTGRRASMQPRGVGVDCSSILRACMFCRDLMAFAIAALGSGESRLPNLDWMSAVAVTLHCSTNSSRFRSVKLSPGSSSNFQEGKRWTTVPSWQAWLTRFTLSRVINETKRLTVHNLASWNSVTLTPALMTYFTSLNCIASAKEVLRMTFRFPRGAGANARCRVVSDAVECNAMMTRSFEASSSTECVSATSFHSGRKMRMAPGLSWR